MGVVDTEIGGVELGGGRGGRGSEPLGLHIWYPDTRLFMKGQRSEERRIEAGF